MVLANQQERPSDLDLGWLIGFTEGEGCFTVQVCKWHQTKAYYNVTVILSNTNRRAVEKLDRILTGLEVGHHVRWYDVERLQRYHRKAKRPIAHITIWGAGRVKKFLEVTDGLWSAKAPQARVLKEFVENPRPFVGPVFDRLYHLSHDLNQGILTDYTPEPSWA